MQEKFVLKSVKALKKVAALSTGIVMLGATLTGALAADLADYPAPFVASGVYNDANALVAGDNAVAADTLGMVDISTNLQFMAKTAVATGGQSVTVSGPAKSMQVALGKGLSNSTYFDPALQDDDLSHLFDGEITFKGTAYDTSEELQFGDTDQVTPYVATSLMTDDDYKSDVFFEVSKDKIRYAYRFDENIELSNVTSTDTLNIDFLGTPMKFTSVAASQFDAYVGEEHYLNTGDTVTVNGKTVKLIDVSSTSVVIEVDGTNKIVTTSSAQTVNGIEVTVDSVFSRTERAESSANLILGVQSSETYKNGDAYVGEDKNDPDWVWNIEGLLTAGVSAYDETPQGGAASAIKVLRVENDFVWNDDTDNPAGVGDCINLPNDYVSICLDSLSVAESDYKDYDFELDTSADFSDAFGSSYAEVNAIHMTTTVDEGFELPAYSSGGLANETSSVKAKDVWLYTFNATASIKALVDGAASSSAGSAVGGFVDVFYKDTSNNNIKYHGAVNASDTTTVIAAINYENTKGTGAQGNVRLMLGASQSINTTSKLNLTLDVNADSTSDLINGQDNINMLWGLSSNAINSLGVTADTEESTELSWGTTPTFIGTKDEDHRTYYGIVIKDPKGQASSDRVKLQIPSDQVFANIVVKGKAGSTSSGGTSYVPAEVSPKTMLSSEVSDVTAYNLVVVGGPCANPLAESVFGVTCDGWAYKEGEALVKVVDNGDKVAMLVAGTTALDTRRAAKAVANYKDYAFSGAEVVVKGTTLSDISVESA